MTKNKNVKVNKSVYIPSIEAETIFDMSERGLENITKYEYVGMIPWSLELLKLRSHKKWFTENEISKNGKVKYQTDAVINIKFKNKMKNGKQFTSSVRGYENLMSRLLYQFKHLKKAIRDNKKEIKLSNNKRMIDKLEKSISYLENKSDLVKGHYKRIKADRDNVIYHEIKADDLRNHLYINGINFKGRHYKFYKRTASKSRQSQGLWILDELYEPMKEWSHMGLSLVGKIDVASLCAYESLVSSSLESTIEINPKNIFVIDDKFSEFEYPAIQVGNDLEAKFNKKAKIKNNIWDGQALIDISLMQKANRGNKGMALLRSHFFKSCAFNCNLQKYLEDIHKEMTNPEKQNYDPTVNPDYTKWKLTDSFGNVVFAKDILLLTTPSSLKFLKFACKGNEKEAYANWCNRVRADRNIMGICKSEKASKYGGRSFTSYQMINTLDVKKQDIEDLAAFEVDFIKELQGEKDTNGNFDESPFIKYLIKNKEITNAYQMFSDIYNINPEVVRTRIFRDYRAKQISNYRTKIKGGKLRLEADYCTVLSCPELMLHSMIKGNGDTLKSELKDNQIHTKLYDYEKKYTLVRNPHNSQNNFFKSINVDNEFYNTYLNLTKNIVVINSIKSPILERLNGMDMDSDTVLIFKSDVFNRLVDRTLANRSYPIILNTIVSEPNPIELTNANVAEIDRRTSKSQGWIGEVTNAAQFQVSVLWDIQNTEPDTPERQKKIEKILKNIAICVVLSNVAIDYSKKIVEVDVDKALRNIRSCKEVKVKGVNKKGKCKLVTRNKPMFWKYVSTADVEMTEFNCPMDLLINHINNDIEKGGYRKNLPFNDLILDLSSEELGGKADDKQIGDIIELLKEFSKGINKIKSSGDDKEGKKCRERQTLMEDSYNELDAKIAKKSIRKATMYKILKMVADQYDGTKLKKTNDLSGIIVHLLNTLYRNHRTTLLNLLKSDDYPKNNTLKGLRTLAG
ncbi:hypothetical protein P4534_21185 [Peribacillus butanolivorans]|uniref:hypothetical protein n=1 Tax=Peribacillus butanolivorans TaxID=421767 RepID=UPI002E2342EA|nr:hypothetical protein [Peribacillus butanolivorans]